MGVTVNRFLDTVGDGTGTKAATGDYTTPQAFVYRPDAGDEVEVFRMLVTIRDTGQFDAAKYGNGVALTVGLKVRTMTAAGVELDFLDGTTIKTNTDWGTFCYDVDVKEWGTGDEVALVRWTFEKSGAPLKLTNDRWFEVLCSDDLQGLEDHKFLIQGSAIIDRA